MRHKPYICRSHTLPKVALLNTCLQFGHQLDLTVQGHQLCSGEDGEAQNFVRDARRRIGL